jgi:hypothetical protein
MTNQATPGRNPPAGAGGHRIGTDARAASTHER